MMNARILALSVALFLAIGTQAFSQTQAKGDSGRIDTLIRKLGSSAYIQREQARKELESIGTPALEPLRRASKTADMETARRIAELIRLFEQQILTQQILTPKEVHLTLKDSSVDQAIEQLTKASGYPIQIQGDRAAYADKKLNLDTGKVSFWQALDRICSEAGLMERIDLTASGYDPGPVRIMAKRGLQRVIANPPSTPAAGPIVLTHRGGPKSAVSYAGSVRTELRITRESATRELNLQFVVSTEPRLLNSTVEGKPLIVNILDGESRMLAQTVAKPIAKNDPNAEAIALHLMALEIAGAAHPTKRFTQIRITEGERPAKELKELLGKLTLQIDLQNELLARLDRVPDAAGKTVKGTNGGKLTLDSIRKLEDGDFELQISMENLTPNPLGNNVAINGNVVIIRGNGFNGRAWGGGIPIVGPGSNSDLPDLIDAKGQKCTVANVTRESTNIINGVYARTVTVVYRLNPTQAEPTELVLFGSRTHTIDVPFRFENVLLP